MKPQDQWQTTNLQLATGYRITYSVATMSYDNYYANLHDYSNSLLSGLL